MRFRVDAAREAADDDEPGSGEIAREAPRDGRAVAGTGTRTDHRDGRPREQLEVGGAAHEQAGRRIVDRAELRRERGGRAPDEPEPVSGEPRFIRAPVERAHVRRVLRSVRRTDQMRSRLGRVHRQRELAHADSSCGTR